ncbi:MAG TPA: hypothetical protein PLI68_00780 [Bacteroidia bacterium]|nr:hypothetical protein [Bacteroidia bacterium]HRH08242.1 hypothetical protein [Bacteroidia bacterium]HRH61835.1 hypothetical protein [Bacteroidia bacterium]
MLRFSYISGSFFIKLAFLKIVLNYFPDVFSLILNINQAGNRIAVWMVDLFIAVTCLNGCGI